jgi:hypothetical protein
MKHNAAVRHAPYTFGNDLAVLYGVFVELPVFPRTPMLQVANGDEMMLAGDAHKGWCSTKPPIGLPWPLRGKAPGRPEGLWRTVRTRQGRMPDAFRIRPGVDGPQLARREDGGTWTI